MASTISLSFRVPPKTAERLDALSEATERPRSWLLEQALSAYLDLQAWQVGHIKKGLAELDRGEGVLHEEVEAWLSTWGTAKERKAPRWKSTGRRRRSRT
jgi:predicted transcriptional regulator